MCSLVQHLFMLHLRVFNNIRLQYCYLLTCRFVYCVLQIFSNFAFFYVVRRVGSGVVLSTICPPRRITDLHQRLVSQRRSSPFSSHSRYLLLPTNTHFSAVKFHWAANTHIIYLQFMLIVDMQCRQKRQFSQQINQHYYCIVMPPTSV